jgi:hypothetical protein
MESTYNKIKAVTKSLQDKYNAGQSETSGLGAELAARSQMNRQGEAALKGNSTDEKAPVAAAPKGDSGKRYGDRPGEKRLDSEGNEIPKYHTGVASVPETGLAVVKKGEKIIKAEDNPDNPDNKNAVEQAVDGDDKVEHTPEEKAHFHRSMAKLHEGGLHDHFGMKHDEPMSMEKKQEAANSDNPHVAAMGHMAVAMAHWHHKHGKK